MNSAQEREKTRRGLQKKNKLLRVATASLTLTLLASGEARLDGPPQQAQPTTRPGVLRVMTYNIHHGAGADGKIDLPRIAAVIRAADPDVVALQEVDMKTTRSDGVDQAGEIARLLGMSVRFGKQRDYRGGEYGQAILSKRPLGDVELLRLPGKTPADERLAFLVTLGSSPGLPPLRIVTTHLHHLDEDQRRLQAEALTAKLLSDAAPSAEVIVMGDLNAMPDDIAMNTLLTKWRGVNGDELTFPATRPVKKIDWVLVPRISRWQVLSSKVPDEQIASDHRPVVVELSWRP